MLKLLNPLTPWNNARHHAPYTSQRSRWQAAAMMNGVQLAAWYWIVRGVIAVLEWM